MTAATRAVASRQEVVHADTVGSTHVTAEIPAVPVHRSYGVLLPDGSVWYPDSKRRLPAPWPIRFVVWVLAMTLLLMLVGLAVVEWHPSWLSSLRHSVGPPSSINIGGGGGGQTGTTLGGTGTTVATTGKNGCTTTAKAADGAPSAVTCTLPTSTYEVVFTTTEPVNYGVKSLPTGSLIYGATQQPGVSHTIAVDGASALQAFATGGTFKVLNGSTVVVPSTPAVFSCIYTFQPPAGTTGG
jgi:hypothetical protein